MIRTAGREPEPEYVSLKLLDKDESGGFLANILR